jgi:hypothetical protein
LTSSQIGVIEIEISGKQWYSYFAFHLHLQRTTFTVLLLRMLSILLFAPHHSNYLTIALLQCTILLCTHSLTPTLQLEPHHSICTQSCDPPIRGLSAPTIWHSMAIACEAHRRRLMGNHIIPFFPPTYPLNLLAYILLLYPSDNKPVYIYTGFIIVRGAQNHLS